MSNIKLAVVGATGLVGQTIIKVLEEKKLPISEYTFFASSRSAGKEINFLGKDYKVQELKNKGVSKQQIKIFEKRIYCSRINR